MTHNFAALPAVPTFGLTHLALRVGDVRHAFEFYQAVFGMVVVFENESFLQAQTPGTHDVLVFEKHANIAGASGDILHFGFRLKAAADIHRAAAAVIQAGGTVLEQGDFVPGEPYLYAHDRYGYLLEIWFELPTPADPTPG